MIERICGRRWLWLLVAGCLWAPTLWAKGLNFSEVTLSLGEDNRIFLDAQLSYELNDTTAEALENGVPLTFVTQVQMRAVDAWFWEDDVASFKLRSSLRFRPLSGLYEVRNQTSTDKQVFATRASALRFMGKIRDMAIIERAQLDTSQDYRVRLNSYLDIEALPLPMRPRAYVSEDWDMQAEPWEWQLRP